MCGDESWSPKSLLWKTLMASDEPEHDKSHSWFDEHVRTRSVLAILERLHGLTHPRLPLARSSNRKIPEERLTLSPCCKLCRVAVCGHICSALLKLRACRSHSLPHCLTQILRKRSSSSLIVVRRRRGHRQRTDEKDTGAGK